MRTILLCSFSLALLANACVSADLEDERASRGSIDPELETIIDDYFNCMASGDECTEERQTVFDREAEIFAYVEELESVEPDAEFRASAYADCGGGASVTCTGYSCYAEDFSGCECWNRFGGTVSVGFCGEDPGNGGSSDGGPNTYCGNQICETGEDENNCYADCHVQECTVGVCNNGNCCNEDPDCPTNHCIML